MSRAADIFGLIIVLGTIIGLASFGIYSAFNDHSFFSLRITHDGKGIPNISVQACASSCDPHTFSYRQVATDNQGIARAEIGFWKGSDGSNWIFVFTYGGTTYQYPAKLNTLVEDPI